IALLERTRKRSRMCGSHDVKRTTKLRRAPAKDPEHPRIVIRRQHDRAAVNDSSLLAGNLPDRRAEELPVVKADRSDEDGEWANDIRRIETSSHPYFEHHHL